MATQPVARGVGTAMLGVGPMFGEHVAMPEHCNVGYVPPPPPHAEPLSVRIPPTPHCAQFPATAALAVDVMVPEKTALPEQSTVVIGVPTGSRAKNKSVAFKQA